MSKAAWRSRSWCGCIAGSALAGKARRTLGVAGAIIMAFGTAPFGSMVGGLRRLPVADEHAGGTG